MGNEMNHIDEGTIHAWLDGALAPDESTRIDAHVQACASCAAAVAEARGLIAASSRILSALDSVPRGVLPGAPRDADPLADIRRRAGTPKPAWWRNRQVLAAASVIFVAGAATVAWQGWNAVNRLPAAEPRVVVMDDSAMPAAPAAELPEPATTVGAGREVQGQATEVVRQELVTSSAATEALPPASARAEADQAVPSQLAGAAKAVAASEAMSLTRRLTDTSRIESTQVAAERAEMVRSAPSAPPALPDPRNAAVRQQFTGGQQLRPTAVGVGDAMMRLPERARVGAAAAHAGCYTLRAPGTVSTRLLGVPVLVQLLREPLAADSSWSAATDLERATVPVSLVWRSIDSTTVELRVRRPLDSTIVRFKAVLAGPPLQPDAQPAGTTVAHAERVVCR